MHITPFVIPDFGKEIATLKSKLSNASFPPTDSLGGSRGDGYQLREVGELSNYWQNAYSFTTWRSKVTTKYKDAHWMAHDVERNCHIHFLNIHLNKKTSLTNNTPLPILFIHGWPGSFLEALPLLQELEATGRSFTVIVPSLPSYAFSSSCPGFGVLDIARVLDKLMVQGLGFTNGYTVQGGDWGGIIARALGAYHSKNAKLIHVNMTVALPSRLKVWQLAQFLAGTFLPNSILPLLGILTRQEAKDLKDNLHFLLFETGYQVIQGTKPQTLAYLLTDSPLGLLAWIGEKFSTWSGTGNERNVLSRDTILDHATLYYLTNSIASSIRIYKNHLFTEEFKKLSLAFCKAPTAVSCFPGDILTFPLSWIQHRYNVVFYRRHPAGGHFAALEQPGLLARDLIGVLDQFYGTSSLPFPIEVGEEQKRLSYYRWAIGLGVGAAYFASRLGKK